MRKGLLSSVLVFVCLLVPLSDTGSQTLPLQPPACARPEGQQHQAFTGEAFARTELYFGSAKPNGGVVTRKEWEEFLNDEITPRFPDGLTVLTGFGQFRDSSGTIIREQSRLLILLYPLHTQKESSEKIEQIREAFKCAFQQQSVLRADDFIPVNVSF